MLIALLQTLAEILVGGTSLTSMEQIDFNIPGTRRDDSASPFLNLYLYDIRESIQVQSTGRQIDRRISEGGLSAANVSSLPIWFDVSLILTAWNRTALGEYHLLNEALTLLLRHRSLREEFLAPELRGFGNLFIQVAATPFIEAGSLWSALNAPLRPALYLTIAVPFEPDKTSVPLIWQRIVGLSAEVEKNGSSRVLHKRVSIACAVKSAVTNLPLAETKVTLIGTEKSATSNQEGLFFFENLRLGNYVVRLNCSGYLPQDCNILVDGNTFTFKEVFLTPV
ncbi:Pvc16 family protein [Scytonema sp. NUACC26]|uniref:Pvc16 family protein n=1 Tax=Scytonema sp. NUACC26 TaxID=3140176 RepID=UPI0034DC69E5